MGWQSTISFKPTRSHEERKTLTKSSETTKEKSKKFLIEKCLKQINHCNFISYFFNKNKVFENISFEFENIY